MSGAFRAGREVRGEHALQADVVVIGTGAGGAMLARDAAEAGRRVIALEMGPRLGPRDFSMQEPDMLEALFQERGARATADGAVRILQGCGVGGSTVHNTNLCKRTPEPILRQWAEAHGVSGCSARELDPLFARTERELNVRPMGPGQLNRHNALFRAGVEALGYRGGFLSHNRNEGCVGSGFCELGCPFDGKENALRVLAPRAVELGAEVWSDARVERVLVRGERAVGVSGTFLDAAGAATGSFSVAAKAVVLAGSAIGSAALHLASGLPDPSGQAGRNLRCHPSAVVAGVFKEDVRAWQGVPQSFECTELLDLEPGAVRRVWLLPGFAHPIGVATTIPGFGREHAAVMRDYPRLAAVIALVHDESAGRVRLGAGGRIRIDYEPDAGDRAQLALGLREGARILLAAGAERVVVPYEASPLLIRSEADLSQVDARGVPAGSIALTAVHPMGTLRMGDDPRRAVVDSRGEHHAVRGLFVADGSLFPTSLGGPPQLSIYTFARHVARRVVEATA